MKMNYDENEKSCYNEMKLTFINFVITAMSPWHFTTFSPFFCFCFLKKDMHLDFEPPKIANKEKALLFFKKIEKEVKKYES